MARILVRVWDLPVDELEADFPPPVGGAFANPLGQVPVLEHDGAVLFPTLIVLEALWRMAGRPDDAYDPDAERQPLMVALSGCDALVANRYQRFAGLRQVAHDNVGYDPGARNLERFGATLRWFDEGLRTGRLRNGPTLPNIAIACALIWSEERGALRRVPDTALAALLDALEMRPSFVSTFPPPWEIVED